MNGQSTATRVGNGANKTQLLYWLACSAALLQLAMLGAAQKAVSAEAPSSSFGRQWFANATRPEIGGFLNGYYDCLPDPAIRALPGWSMSNSEMTDRIADYYAQHGADLSVAQVATAIAKASPGRTRDPHAEAHPGRHGFFDGLWWKGGSDSERLGYVEGFLTCLKRPTTAKRSRGIEEAVTAWYAGNPDRESSPIASVLQQVLKASEPKAAPGLS